MIPNLFGVAQQPFALDHVESGKRRGDAYRVATKSRSVGSRHPIHDVGLGQRDPERHSGRDAFGHANNVRLHASVLDRPPFTCASCAALDFIGNQQNAVPIANPAQLLHEVCGCRDIATLSLYRLDENCRYFLRRQSGFEQLLFNETGTGQCVLRAFAIHIGEWNVGYSRH